MQIFLILNFNTTELCINLIQQLLPINLPIVVVDNNSNLEEYKELCKKVKDYDNVELLRTEENLGFARGNNFGYTYIKNKYKNIDAIHCLNTDIEIDNIKVLVQAIEDNMDEAYVITPNVLTNNYNSSPMIIRDVLSLKQDVKKELKQYKKKIIKHSIASKLNKFYRQYMHRHNSFVLDRDLDLYKYQLDKNQYFVYSGCYLVFTKLYIETYDYLFNSKTFLYHEEDFLFYRLFKNKQQTMFLPDIYVKHLENPLSRIDIKTNYQRLYQSLALFLEEISSE